jgi:integrase
MQAYMDAKDPSRNDRRYLGRLKGAWLKGRKMKLGNVPVGDIVQMDIDQAAAVLYPGARPSTKNRQAYAPAAAVLHYAAGSEIVPWRRIAKLREAEPETRRPLQGTAAALLDAAEGIQGEFLLFLFLQGWRISESLGQRWEDTDLQARIFRVWVSKVGKWKTIHMHPEVFLVLAQRSRDEGPLWPWRDRHDVYRWLRPLRNRAGVRFTPHMARHEWGSQQNEAGGTARDAMEGNTWTNVKSVMRYQAPSAEHGRKIASRVTIGAKTGLRHAK